MEFKVSTLLLRFFFSFVVVQATAILGCMYVFGKSRSIKIWVCVFVAVVYLNSAYLFLFSPPLVQYQTRILIEYLLLYPFFIYMLICLVLTPLFLLTGIFYLIKKMLSALRSWLRMDPSTTGNVYGPVNKERRAFLKMTTSSIILPMAGCSLYGSYFGQDKLAIEEKQLFFPDLADGMDGLSIVQISDIHAGPFMDRYRLAGFVDSIYDLKPDIVVITGDIINWGNQYVNETVQVLADIDASRGVFAVLGNHDYYCNLAELCGRLEDAGIQVLRNCWQEIQGADADGALYLIGIDDPGRSWYLNRNFPGLPDALAGIPDGSFKLLLSHRPNVFEYASRAGIQLTLAGHTHGGQVIVPVPGGRGVSLARVAYEQDFGLYRTGNACLYVNRGLGVVGPPVRLNCPREITRIVLRKS